jgi:hypothetical protein
VPEVKKRRKERRKKKSYHAILRYRTSQAVAERRVDALEPHVLYVGLPRLILRPAEQPQVPLFRVRPCTSGVFSGDYLDQPRTQTRCGCRSRREQKQLIHCWMTTDQSDRIVDTSLVHRSSVLRKPKSSIYRCIPLQSSRPSRRVTAI